MTTTALDKLPPHDTDAEASVLASCMVDDEAPVRCMAECDADDFFREKNAWIFAAIKALTARKEPCSPIFVANELAKLGQLEGVGGLPYLTQLTTDLPTAVGSEYYARIIRSAANRRRMISVAGRLAQMAYDEKTYSEWNDLYSQGMDQLGSLSQYALSDNGVWMSAAEIEQHAGPVRRDWMAAPGQPLGYITGMYFLDYATDGLQKGRLYFIAGGTGAGKTLLAQQIGLRLANGVGIQPPLNTCYLSTEMTGAMLADRAVYSKASIDRQRGKRMRAFQDEDVLAEYDASEWFSKLPFYVSDRGPFDWPIVRARIMQAVHQRGAQVIIMDHVDDMTHPGIGAENGYALQSLIAREAKQLALELDVPIIALSQNSRPPGENYGDIPTLHSLQGSGRKEQSADWVGFVWRPAIYDPTLPEDHPQWHEAYLIVQKNREGPIGTHPFYVDLGKWQLTDWDLSQDGEPVGMQAWRDKKAGQRKSKGA